MDNDAILALQIDRLMRRFHTDLHPRASEIDTDKIGPIGGMMLFVLSETSPITSQALAQTISRDKAQVSRLVSLLTRKGFIDKQSRSDDSRYSELTLTEKGHLQVAAFNGALVETTRQTLAPLDQTEIQEFSRLLSKILNAKQTTP